MAERIVEMFKSAEVGAALRKKTNAELVALLLGQWQYLDTLSPQADLLSEVIERLEQMEGLAAPEREDTNWIQTATGRQFWPLNPRPDDVDVRDIARGLANEARYNGQTRWHYSVAQHSVYVSLLVPPPLALQGLFHDAPEAYAKDLPRPLKRWVGFTGYKAVEERLHLAICAKLGISPELPPEIKAADNAVLMAERHYLHEAPPHPWVEKNAPADIIIGKLTPEEAEHAFLVRYVELGGVLP